MCITTNQPDTKSNPNPNLNPNLTTKQHATVNTQLNTVMHVIFIKINSYEPMFGLAIDDDNAGII